MMVERPLIEQALETFFKREGFTIGRIPGIRRALKEGRYACGPAPIGYSWDRTKSRPMIVPNEQAPLVKEAFEMPQVFTPLSMFVV